ncbi:unnamed protein product [Amoebophrya sp. A25]|nr:unnamed protein product [Amoebophrya sp. A25]|eukprot:GSA25T00011772001.1
MVITTERPLYFSSRWKGPDQDLRFERDPENFSLGCPIELGAFTASSEQAMQDLRTLMTSPRNPNLIMWREPRLLWDRRDDTRSWTTMGGTEEKREQEYYENSNPVEMRSCSYSTFESIFEDEEMNAEPISEKNAETASSTTKLANAGLHRFLSTLRNLVTPRQAATGKRERKQFLRQWMRGEFPPILDSGVVQQDHGLGPWKSFEVTLLRQRKTPLDSTIENGTEDNKNGTSYEKSADVARSCR